MVVSHTNKKNARQPEDGADACTSRVPQCTYNLPSLYTTLQPLHIHAGLIPRGSAALHTYTTRHYIRYTHTLLHNPHKNRIITTFYPYFVKI